MNCLRRDASAVKFAVSNSFGDVGKMHRRAVGVQNNVNFIANVLWVNGWPFG